MSYYILAKPKTGKRYFAVDLIEGRFVRNTINASVFNDKEKAEYAVKRLSETNPEIQFKLKAVQILYAR